MNQIVYVLCRLVIGTMNRTRYLFIAVASVGALLIAGVLSAISASAQSSISSSSLVNNNMVTNNNNTNNNIAMPMSNDTTRVMPTTQWISLKGITLKPGEFLDLADTTPVLTTKGHVAAYLPCDVNGNTTISFVQGRVDVGVNTLKPLDAEYLKQLSNPGQDCMYHFDIGTPNGVTDFAIINNGTEAITFGDRNTITMTFAEALQNLEG